MTVVLMVQDLSVILLAVSGARDYREVSDKCAVAGQLSSYPFGSMLTHITGTSLRHRFALSSFGDFSGGLQALGAFASRKPPAAAF
jgi:hypothetical protein